MACKGIGEHVIKPGTFEVHVAGKECTVYVTIAQEDLGLDGGPRGGYNIY